MTKVESSKEKLLGLIRANKGEAEPAPVQGCCMASHVAAVFGSDLSELPPVALLALGFSPREVAEHVRINS